MRGGTSGLELLVGPSHCPTAPREARDHQPRWLSEDPGAVACYPGWVLLALW